MDINWEPKEIAVITHLDNVVLTTRQEHKSYWRGHDDEYWFARLVQEVDELRASLNREHSHSPEHELVQIASICMNWMDKRVGPQRAIRVQRGYGEAGND